MPEFLEYSIKPPFRDLKGRFTKANEELVKAKRDEMRTLGSNITARFKSAAPVGKTGKFRDSHTFKTFERGTDIELRFYSASPLGTYIRRGTKPHVIRAKRAKALAFFWPKVGMQTFVPKAGFPITGELNGAFWIGKGFVNHPGTKPNPYQERALASMSPAMRDSLNKIAGRWTETVKA